MSFAEKTRAHLNYGICRQCWGTGTATARDGARGTCRDCRGEGALA